MLNTLNRKKAPALQQVGQLSIPEPEVFTLSNGISVYVLNEFQRDISQIELVFKAGRWHEPQKQVAKMANVLLREGTTNYSAKELAEEMDFFGASIKLSSDGDTASVKVSGLNKHLDKVMPLAQEVILRPAFLEEELTIKTGNYKQRLKVNLQKNDYLADRSLHELLYGAEHPYGYLSHAEDYDAITVESLKAFHKQYYTADNCMIVVVGRGDDNLIPLLEQYFGQNDWKGEAIPNPEYSFPEMNKVVEHQAIENSFQAAIRVGRRLFNKNHPDYYKMHFLNTALGGYFGSRLMSNIREDKGYTYGIYSSITSMMHDGYFYISTEVGTDVSGAALKEIYMEMERLKNETIPKDEMDLVRNYLLGRLLSGLDGPFKLANIYKGLLIHGIGWDAIHRLIETTKTTSAKDLQDMAQQYFDLDKMHEVVIG